MTTKMTIESVVFSAYGKVLGVSPTRLSTGSDFVSLGGLSLKAAEVAALLKQAYPSLEVTPQDILRCRTAGGLVDFIKRQGIS